MTSIPVDTPWQVVQSSYALNAAEKVASCWLDFHIHRQFENDPERFEAVLKLILDCSVSGKIGPSPFQFWFWGST
jgi:hypothetical protein